MRSGRAKAEITVDGLRYVRASRGATDAHWAIVARFAEARGLAAVTGRGAIARLSLCEVARFLGAVPASVVEDPEDMKHLVRAMEMLERNGKARKP